MRFFFSVLNFETVDTACQLSLADGSTAITVSAGCTLESSQSTALAQTVSELATKVADLQTQTLPTAVVHFDGNCNKCRSYDFKVGQGNHFADVEAWGGHQGGGMHGAYIGGKYSLNGYIEVKPIGTIVDEAWGTCGSWSVIRPSRAETANPCVVAAENVDCSISNPSACKWSNLHLLVFKCKLSNPTFTYSYSRNHNKSRLLADRRYY